MCAATEGTAAFDQFTACSFLLPLLSLNVTMNKMTNLVLLLAVCGFVHCNDDQPQTQWKLVDCFDFAHISTEQLKNDPNFDIEDEVENLCQGLIYQHSCHRMANVAIRDGHLEISANVNVAHKNSRFLFNTGQLASTKAWQYGRFVMRAKLPEGKLLRSVFVLKPKKKIYPGKSWLDNGQINGLVYSQQADAISSGLHYRMDNSHSYAGRKFPTKQNLTSSFHLYSLEWTNSSIRFFFDDVLFFENAVTKPFDQLFYFVLQLGVGGPEFDTRNVAIKTSDAALWHNNRFVIDYIKVFKEEPVSRAVSQPTSGTSYQTLPVVVMAICSLFSQLIVNQ